MQKNIISELGEDVFSLRLLKDEGVGIATDKNGKNYFLFDSKDYWYDLIQERYPSELKCKCKNKKFMIIADYEERSESNDVKCIHLTTRCETCGSEKKQMSIDIDYSPTNQLVEMPLEFCEKPKIKYKYYELTMFWVKKDLIDFLRWLRNKKYIISVWYWENDSRKLSVNVRNEIFDIVDSTYLSIYISENEPVFNVQDDEKSVYVQREIWRKEEIIELGSPISMVYEMNKRGNLYYMHFCTEFIKDGRVFSKTEEFCNNTKQVIEWLKTRYVIKRGKNCYDNQNELERLFGEKYV